jgi:hypothetical protein
VDRFVRACPTGARLSCREARLLEIGGRDGDRRADEIAEFVAG